MSHDQRHDIDRLREINAELGTLDQRGIDLRSDRARLIARLQASGMTLAEIGEHVGVTRQRVHQWAQTP